nr:5 kDa protein [Cucurbit yellow stunting disorder virus]
MLADEFGLAIIIALLIIILGVVCAYIGSCVYNRFFSDRDINIEEGEVS